MTRFCHIVFGTSSGCLVQAGRTVESSNGAAGGRPASIARLESSTRRADREKAAYLVDRVTKANQARRRSVASCGFGSIGCLEYSCSRPGRWKPSNCAVVRAMLTITSDLSVHICRSGSGQVARIRIAWIVLSFIKSEAIVFQTIVDNSGVKSYRNFSSWLRCLTDTETMVQNRNGDAA